MKKWVWPNPVLLKQIEDEYLGRKVWNSKINPIDKKDIFPVITPCYPSMNSTYNVSPSTLDQMKTEFERGKNITLKIETNDGAKWEELFEDSDFFFKIQGVR